MGQNFSTLKPPNVTPSHSTAQCYIITAVKFYTLLQKYTLCAVLVGTEEQEFVSIELLVRWTC